MKTVVENIKKVRKEKGISHDYLAHQLNISQAAYSKLERNDTKLTVERLYKISEVLETPLTELLEVDSKTIYNQDLRDHAIGYQGVENLYQENKEQSEKIKELYEARLKDKDALIEQLKKVSV